MQQMRYPEGFSGEGSWPTRLRATRRPWTPWCARSRSAPGSSRSWSTPSGRTIRRPRDPTAPSRRGSAPSATTEEIGAPDPDGVEWAVLSACDTGVGEIRAGEGVLGLRRAFEVAGARTLVMSLWPVEDRTAPRWMRELYGARLENGSDVARAARAASLAVLERQRASDLGGHPSRWAAFVAAGGWR